MKLSARVAKLEGTVAKLPRRKPVDFENPKDRLIAEQLVVASRMPEYRGHWKRLNELTLIGEEAGVEAMPIQQLKEFEQLYNEMLRAGAAIHSG